VALLLDRPQLTSSSSAARVGAPVVVTAVIAVCAALTVRGLGVPWVHPVIFGNWALPHEYLAIGTEVGKRVGDSTVESHHEIGTIAYACECSVVDEFSDPGRALPLIDKRIREAGPVMRALLEANFARLDWSEKPRRAEYRLVWTRAAAPRGVPVWGANPVSGPAIMYLKPIKSRSSGGGGI
jgi:hypothetical protein